MFKKKRPPDRYYVWKSEHADPRHTYAVYRLLKEWGWFPEAVAVYESVDRPVNVVFRAHDGRRKGVSIMLPMSTRGELEDLIHPCRGRWRDDIWRPKEEA